MNSIRHKARASAREIRAGIAAAGKDRDAVRAAMAALVALEDQIHKSGEPIGGHRAIWYGPHDCDQCGQLIVKRAAEQGPYLALDATRGPVYPNTPWPVHLCAGRSPIV